MADFVEEVAKAIRDTYVREERPDRPSWEETPEHRKTKWRHMAHAAIDKIEELSSGKSPNHS